MRTTVDLPPYLHQRTKELAERRGESLSKTLADLTARGLNELDQPTSITTDPRSGLPVIRRGAGRRVTHEETMAFLEEDANDQLPE